ncbi:hypothetical protein EMIT079MI2_420020 [Bacillus sp. IT-79MI2]
MVDLNLTEKVELLTITLLPGEYKLLTTTCIPFTHCTISL